MSSRAGLVDVYHTAVVVEGEYVSERQLLTLTLSVGVANGAIPNRNIGRGEV